MINLLNSPLATRSKASAMIWWCLPEINTGHIWDTKNTNDSRHLSALSNSSNF